MFAAIYLAHTDPATFPDPYAFRPERFLDAKPDTFSWIPFGGGTSRCIGAAFAQLEMRVVLRTILRARGARAGDDGAAGDRQAERDALAARGDPGGANASRGARAPSARCGSSLR